MAISIHSMKSPLVVLVSVTFSLAFSVPIVTNDPVANDEGAPSFVNRILGGVVDVVTGGIKKSPHIIGGEEAKPHSHPHQVALIGHRAHNKQHRCGGSLIAPEWVLTASHCTTEVVRMTADLGSHDINAPELGRQSIRVRNIISKKWSLSTLVNDIALLRLERPATLRTSTPASVLRYVESELVSNGVCSAWYRGNIPTTLICTNGEQGKGACKGDSGGPMIMTELDGKRTLIGITSFVHKSGCEFQYPTVFTRVDHYLDWIVEHTNITLRQK